MKKIVLSTVLFMALSCTAVTAQDETHSHLKDLDSVRSSMTEIGNKLPNVIKTVKPADVKSLERIFEINNYAMMTIESYFKMLRVATLSGGGINKDIVDLVNNWLNFIANYCENDIKYLDELRTYPNDKVTSEIIEDERSSISRLIEAAKKGIVENSNLVSN